MPEVESTKRKLIQLASIPISYSELKESLGISDPAIQRHLTDLKKADLIQKGEGKEGKYELTVKGKLKLEEFRAQERTARSVRLFSDIGLEDHSRVAASSVVQTMGEITKELAELARCTRAIYGQNQKKLPHIFGVIRELGTLDHFVISVLVKEMTKDNELFKPQQDLWQAIYGKATLGACSADELNDKVKGIITECSQDESKFKDYPVLSDSFEIIKLYLEHFKEALEIWA